jgi:hypothetical protein
MRYDRQYLLWGLVYAVLGMGLGIYMAATQSRVQYVTHAHILLVGFVVSVLYAAIHKLWLDGRARRLALVQFISHQAGAVAMFAGLFLLYGGFVALDAIDPVLAGASIAVLLAALLMLFMAFRHARQVS